MCSLILIRKEIDNTHLHMAEHVGATRLDSMTDKEINADEVVESVTEDTESGSHKDGAFSDRELNDLEKADSKATAPEPLRRTITAQDWDGPDDPENPLNWYDKTPGRRQVSPLTYVTGVS